MIYQKSNKSYFIVNNENLLRDTKLKSTIIDLRNYKVFIINKNSYPYLEKMKKQKNIHQN